MLYSMIVVAEIGTSHNGSVEKAYSLIDAACDAGADVVKFQWVYASEILHPDTGFVKLPGGNIRLYDRFRSLEVPFDFYEKCLESYLIHFLHSFLFLFYSFESTFYLSNY